MSFTAKNKITMHELIAGSPDTYNDVPDYSCTAIISAAVDGMTSKKSTTWGITTDDFSTTFLDFLEAAIGTTQPTDADPKKYEDGVESTAGVSSSAGNGKRYIMFRYGGVTTDAFIHVAIANCFVTDNSWAHTTTYEETIEPAFEIKTILQAAGNSPVLSVGGFDSAIVQTTTPTPTLPTALTGGTYGKDYGMEAA